MPLRMAPGATEVVPSKKVRMPGFEEKGQYEEYFLIRTYLDEETEEAARKASTGTRVPTGKGVPAEDFDARTYRRRLIAAQLTGWRLIAPPDASEKDTTALEDGPEGVRFWAYKPETVATLPWDAVDFLFRQIQICGGEIPTRDVLVEMDGKQVLDFRRAYEGLGAE